VEVDRHVVCNQSREGTLEDLACTNEGYVTFGYKIVVENRVCQCVWFSEKGVGSIVEREDRKAAVCDDTFDGVEHS